MRAGKPKSSDSLDRALLESGCYIGQGSVSRAGWRLGEVLKIVASVLFIDFDFEG